MERMVAAGAIVLGRTNIPEFAFQGWTDNDVFGPTRNPWGLEWSPGGSSGGSGAALAAGLVPLATGTDGGGSIRTPAAFCGLAGLKPTAGLIGRRPIPSWLEFSTQGPLAPGIDDAKLLLHVMRGPAQGDPSAAPSWQYGGGKPKRVLATPRSRDVGPLPPEVDEPFRAALAAIERDLGLPVEEIPTSSLFPTSGVTWDQTRDDWYVTVTVEELYLLGREWVEAHLDDFSAIFRSEMESALEFTLSDYLTARRRRFTYTADLDRLLGDDGILVCPTHGYEGWLRGRDAARNRPSRRARGLQHGRVQPERAPGPQRSCRHVCERPALRARGRGPAVPRRPGAGVRRCVGGRPPVAGDGARLRAVRDHVAEREAVRGTGGHTVTVPACTPGASAGARADRSASPGGGRHPVDRRGG